MNPNIPRTDRKRVVIVGAGFGGLQLARKLSSRKEFQVVLINKHNFHEFQPLYYQVATSGLEASSILFPLRAVFQNCKNVHIRVTTVTAVHPDTKTVDTDLGPIDYDYLVVATGADTNFFGMKNIIERALPMKSVSEAIALRNRVLQNFEDALSVDTLDEKEGFLNVVVVGGGPTGVELCGTFAEMRKTVLPSDYPELDFKMMQIYLIESGAELLGPMSVESQVKSQQYLEKLGVIVKLNTRVQDFDGRLVHMADGSTIRTNNLVWAAGVKANPLNGLPAEATGRGGRLLVNRFSQVQGFTDIFALGDIALMTEEKYPNGHPQIAQPAIQQGKHLAKNLVRMGKDQPMEPFTYKDLGTMATIGRGKAVVDLPFWSFQGVFAWMVWLFVHLMAIVGVKNRLLILVNWAWNYLSDDQSLRLIIKPKLPKGSMEAIQKKVEDQLITK
ncbi:NAD(P)/FAD-dependent oxidoreductase [Larkinella humicola]|uniref:NADH:ubiquinone reductase (non-electrogenic) n=1 Tax=Larkinella humicola TaxID=2607654 RepID=A0A5N1JJH3_9BACT|nr:NAD(P)/FAD-dependent oxidoreductase [Larkinella humicola]KAA9356241.1 NAD(P)/FAD-dependent oxidoreductase [Larkinella humicola]